MPLCPSENMATSLIKHSITPRINERPNELDLNGKLREKKIGEHTIFSLRENSDAIKGLYIPPAMHASTTSINQVKINRD